jgi:DNA-binding IclR family transcriptional regulator
MAAAKGSNPAKAPNHSLTLERGLSVLRVLGEEPAGLSVSELAKRLSTHRPGVYRLLGPLLEQRLVHRAEDGRYTLGIGLIELAGKVRSRLQDVAVPELQRLADEVEATTALTLRDGDAAVVAAVLEPRNTEMHIAYRTGLRHELDQAASGVAILASLPPAPGEREAIVEARRRGWAYSSGELLAGASGVGVAIANPGNADGASISAVWIGERDAEGAADLLKASAGRIEAALSGGRGASTPSK